jgi:Zn-dependent alcohol dehydrogenase
LVDDYLAGKVKVDEFVTSNMTLDQINDAFELMRKPVGGK